MSRSGIKGVNKYLRAKRIESGVTQAVAARKIGHSTAQYISNLERGLCEPSIEMAFVLNGIYGASPRALKEFMLTTYQKQLEAKINAVMRG